jgi:hypothetical protein
LQWGVAGQIGTSGIESCWKVQLMLKSIGVVLGSDALSVVLAMATDPLLSRLFPGDFVKGRVPSETPLITSTALFVVVSIFCAWVCARFAPGRAGRHVLWFFILGELMGIGATIPNWSKGWPHWYWLSWLLTWPVSCWIGLLLGGRRSDSTT